MVTFAGLPAAFSAWYFALRSGLKRRAKAGHVEGLANIGPAAPDEGAAAPFCRGRRGLRPLVPSSGMSMVSVQAVASEAPYAGQDFAALGSVGIGFHEGKHRLIDIAEFTWICSSHSLLWRLSKASGQGLGSGAGCGAILDQSRTGQVPIASTIHVAATRELLLSSAVHSGLFAMNVIKSPVAINGF